MIAQFFEVQVNDGQIERYLDLVAALKPALDAMGGCLFIDRLKCLRRDNLLLSYQIWQDEGSLTAWRVDAKHHGVQEVGREQVLPITVFGSRKSSARNDQAQRRGPPIA